MKRILLILTAPILFLSAAAQSLYPGTADSLLAVKPTVTPRVSYFPLDRVKLLPGRFRENLQRDSAWMMSIPVGSLVHSFRTTAGINAGREGGYMTVRKLGGWESLDCELRGHTTGHLLSALALMYATTGQDCFKLKGDSIVTALAAVQRAHGNGYLSAFPEELINRNIRGESVWAPWYTLHKILSGLIDQYTISGNATALQLARGMGDWASGKLSAIDETTRRRMIRNEFGGINDAFYSLYALTAEPRYLQCAEFFYHPDVIDPLKQGNFDMGTKHTNTFIPKVIAEARRYELLGDTTSLQLSRTFFDKMTSRHTLAPGCLSDKEHYFAPEEMHRHTSGYTGETCCTYNMLKLNRHLFSLDPRARMLDYYETALYNHILGQQDPATGMVAYFLPVMTGSHKVYSTRDSSYWCCVGSGFESHAKYAEQIFAHDNHSLYVNLYISAALDWKENAIQVKLLNDFNTFEKSQILIADAPTGGSKTTLKLRVPAWSSATTVAINGKRVKTRTGEDGYIALSRRWHSGDSITVTHTPRLTVSPLPGDETRFALYYGPLLLAGALGTEGMESPAPYSNPQLYNDYYTYNYHIPPHLQKTTLNPATLRRVAPLQWTTPDGITVLPLSNLHRQRHVIYWSR